MTVASPTVLRVNALKRYISSTGTDPIHVRKAQPAAGDFSSAWRG
ncbi:MAG TPA: hypothetical protein VND96_07895 [Candidatus Micrarchaeaceae archaeon]|nr:hypothetical protein [Candidatus Micrarchaeaceae archaeon]